MLVLGSTTSFAHDRCAAGAYTGSVCPASVASCICLVPHLVQPALLPLIGSSWLSPVRFGTALLLLVRFEFLALNPIFVGALDPTEAKALDHKMARILAGVVNH